MSKSESSKEVTFARALNATWPVLIGYFPIGMAFGILYGNILLSFLSGLVLYAGASQFLSVKLFEDHSSWFEIWMSTFFLNLRHVFYGLHLQSRFKKFPFFIKLYSIFSLTDETYAILIQHEESSSIRDAGLVWRISFFNQMSWVMGCGLGAILKTKISIHLKGLDFILVGLFIVLLVEQFKKNGNWKILFVAVGLGVLGIYSKNSVWLFWAMTGCVLYGLLFSPIRELKYE